MLNKRIIIRILSLSLVFIIVFTSFVFAQGNVTKDETVYVNLTHDGKVKDIIVSDWLHSDERDIKIKDKSILKGINNVKGDETPDIKGENLIWKTNKGEIYYQGKTNKSLPLSVEISYSLNGKKIEPELLAGKSGKFNMTVKIVNNNCHKVTINGKVKKLYTPFAAVTVLNFPTDKCKNVKVNTGKVLNDGNNTVITYATVPGLKESLDIDDEDFDDIFDLPEILEIEADVDDFEIGDILITAESDSTILNDIKRSDDIIDETIDGVNDLADASDDVKSGIETLDYGTNKLLENFADFSGGMHYLKDATAKLDENVNNKILEGSKSLTEGTDEFTEKLDELKDGTEKLFEGSEDLAEGAKEACYGASKVKCGTRTLLDGIEQFQQSVGENAIDTKPIKYAVENAVKDAVESAIKAAIASDPSLTEDQINNLIAVGNAVGEKAGEGTGEAVKDAVDTKIYTLSVTLNGGLEQLLLGARALNSGAGELRDGLKELSNGCNDLRDGIEELDDNVGLFKDGANDLTDGAHELSDGLETLSEGTSTLKNGVNGLTEATDAVNDGISDLKDGTETLYDGYDEFDNDGVAELHTKVIDKTDSYDEIFEIKDQLAVLSNNYNNFSGIEENMEGKVKFVMKIDSIEVEKVEEEKIIEKEEETGFIFWLKNKWNSIFNK